MGSFLHPKKIGAKNFYIRWVFLTSLRLNGEYLRKKTRHKLRQSGKDAGTIRRVPCTASKLHEHLPTNGLKWDRHFHPPSINFIFYFIFIARLCTRRSANRTQPKFVTRWEVNNICKCVECCFVDFYYDNKVRPTVIIYTSVLIVSWILLAFYGFLLVKFSNHG